MNTSITKTTNRGLTFILASNLREQANLQRLPTCHWGEHYLDLWKDYVPDHRCCNKEDVLPRS